MPLKVATIPRFLLPQRGAIWNSQTIRNASSKVKSNKSGKPAKPLVLEKPARFNPPSHGSKISKGPPRYQYAGPQMSAEEKAAQAKKKYPNLMPPEGSFMYWFLNNRAIHLYITMTVLTSLAFIVWSTNFKRNSPFAHMLPTWSETLFHPFHSTRTFFHVIRLNTEYTAAETAERRKGKVDDVQKRAAYRKAHGLDQDEGFGGWTAKSDSELMGPAIPSGDGSMTTEEAEIKRRPPVKKWFGIW